MQQYIPWLCWLSPAIGSIAILILGAFNKTRKYGAYLSISSIGLSFLFSLMMLPEVINGQTIDLKLQIQPPLEIGVLLDPLSVLMSVIISLIGFFVALFSYGYMDKNKNLGLTRFWFIMQLFISGYLVIVLANNLLFMFIGWEIVGLSVTFLTAYEYKKRKKANLGFRVNSILRVSDVGMLFFILIVFAYTGTFNFVTLSEDLGWIGELSRSGFLLFSLLMFFSGIAGKSAQFPFHEWLPDMLVGTPSSSNALTEVLAGPYLLARMLPMFRAGYLSGFEEISFFFLIVAWIGGITGLLSALTASVQHHPQRIMAYSISSIVGFMLTALGLAGLNNSLSSAYLAGTTILTIDAFVSALLILSTVLVSYAVNSENLFNLRGFHSKLAHNGMEIAIFAMINIPPFSGFWLSNWVQSLSLELANGVNREFIFVFSGYGIFSLLILAGGVTAFYGLRLLGLTFQKSSFKKKIKSIPRSMYLSFAFLLAVTIILDITVPVLIPILNMFFLPIVQEIVFSNVFEFLLYIIPSISTVLTLTALGIGGYISYQIYFVHKLNSKDIRERHKSLMVAHSFFLNRCYINVFYTKIGSTVEKVSKILYHTMEMEGIKSFRLKGFNEFFRVAFNWVSSLSDWIYSKIEIDIFERIEKIVVKKVTAVSDNVLKIQTGNLSYNIILMLFGAFVLAILLLFFGGLLRF